MRERLVKQRIQPRPVPEGTLRPGRVTYASSPSSIHSSSLASPDEDEGPTPQATGSGVHHALAQRGGDRSVHSVPTPPQGVHAHVGAAPVVRGHYTPAR